MLQDTKRLPLIHAQSAKLPVSEETVLKLHRLTGGDIWDAGKYKDQDGISRIRAASRSTSEPQGRENYPRASSDRQDFRIVQRG